MLNKKIHIIFSLVLHLGIGFKITFLLKPTDFCIIKQECKGYYENNNNKNYQTKCESIKCKETQLFNTNCGLNICSRNLFACNEYMSQMNSKERRNKLKLFIEKINYCNIYKFKSNDYCKSDQNCKIILAYGYHKMSKKIDCNCTNNVFKLKCDQYCTKSLDACDYLKSNENFSNKNIKFCGNHNIIYY